MERGRRKSRGSRGGGSMFMDGYITRRNRGDDDYDRAMNEENRPKSAAKLSIENQLKNETHNIYPIGGVKIKFPCKPYPSQFSMMGMIVKGLDRSQNCLLESPTGSGKSLALLCSVLAWQQAYKEKMREEESKDKKECSCKHGAKSTVPPYLSTTLANLVDETLPTEDSDSSVILVSDDDDDDFKKPVKKLRKSFQGQGAAGGRPHVSISYDATPTATGATPTSRGGATPMDEDWGGCACECQQDPPPNRKTPKIYFGTRTHKQIAQIARELAKTEYRNVKLTILSSREQTCIDLEVSQVKNKSEACKEKRDGVGCLHFDNVRKVTHRNLEVNGLDMAWDLEDLVGFCTKNNACPYYGARGMRETADIIFCPYNYLIDPVIRTQMEINLKGEVLILDEAHNMEDAAREAASYSVSNKELEEAVMDFNKVINYNIKVKEHKELLNMVESLGQWVETFKDSLVGDNYDNANRVWNGVDMVAQLTKYKIGPEDMDRLKQTLSAVLIDEDPDKPPLVKITNATAVIIEKTLFVVGYIFRDNYKFMNDYRIALVRTMSYAAEKTEGEWLGRNRRRSDNTPTWLFTLHFWCMNPAVAFSDLADTRSIILTSGTLSPMNTFQSELDQPFPIQLEANHVINAKQVWVGAVSKGPRGNSLLGTYQNAETFTYQDEIGQLVLSVCKTVPHGVLCFLSSYRMMDKLINRWQNTGLRSELSRYKVFMKEPRKADKENVDFDELLKEFYATIKDTEHADGLGGEQNGVFFMAVCRGKVSEGMDFADNNARAVITVGIPFPNVKDTQVGLKKKYNNEHSQKRGLLTGQDWYEIQAYRAINQALGRCIRHRYDWGALIMIDERFAKNPAKYTKGLSKWVRSKVQYYGNHGHMQRSLQEFTENMVSTPPGPGQDQSMSVSQMMDGSGAVDTTQHPYSQGPTILPPRPASSNSPPMDLYPTQTPGDPTGYTPSLSASHRGTPGYMLTSQAGGFMASQNQYLATQRGAGGTQPAQTQEDVLAAPPDTQYMNLDQTLDFAPPMAASTQRPGRPFDPGFTSTQRGTQQTEAGFLDVSLIKPPYKTPVKSNVPSMSVTNHGVSPLSAHDSQVNKATPKCETLSAPVLSFKQNTVKKGRKSAKEDDPDFEIPRSQSAKAGGISKRLSQSVDLTVRCGDEELDIDERSSSPLLFDSEELDEVKKTEADFDAVVEHLADTTLPREPPQVHELEYSESEPNLGVKRLFKPIKNTIKEEESTVSLNDSSTTCKVTGDIDQPVVEGRDENVPPIHVEEPMKPKHAKGRLSRRRSKDSMNASLLTQTPDAKIKPSDKAEEAIQNNPNQTVHLDSSKNKSVTQTNLRGAPRPATKRVAKGVNFDSDEEDAEKGVDEIVTKRAYRNKRRRVLSASNHASTSDFLDDVQATLKEAVCCKCCGIRLIKGMEGVTQEDLPSYVKSVIPARDQRHVRKMSPVCNYGNTCLSPCKPLHDTGVDGVKLNSVWSEEAGCCLVLYRCPSSQCSKAPVAVRITATAANSTATEGQVWFLPHTTAVSEPT